jgi:all-trans-8'-apo-beta-carotenal 15,15'-oxygenase
MAPASPWRRFVYCTASRHPQLNVPQQAIAKVDLATGRCESWCRSGSYYTGEPVFVPRPAAPAAQQAAAAAAEGAGSAGGRQAQQEVQEEDHGWLLSLCYDAESHSSELVVLDARRVASGPVATLRLQQPVPHGLHGAWVASE